MNKFPSKKIIAFEGLDNCFKETNFKHFSKNLKNEFPNELILTESFPRYGYQSCISVEKWLDGSLNRDMLKKYPQAINNLYAVDRLHYWYENTHGQKNNMQMLEETNACFIFDRYTISGIIYNPIKSIDIYDNLLFEHNAFGIPNPDIVVWLRNNNLEDFLENLNKKINKDKNETDIEYLKNVYEKSEFIINSDIFKIAGIDLIVIDINSKDELCKYKSEMELVFEIFEKVSNVLEDK